MHVTSQGKLVRTLMETAGELHGNPGQWLVTTHSWGGVLRQPGSRRKMLLPGGPGGEEMEKAFIVTTGIYSDKSIQAVFSTREKAETFAEFHPGGDAEVVEFTVDEIDPDKPEIRFTTVLMERNGELYKETQDPY